MLPCHVYSDIGLLLELSRALDLHTYKAQWTYMHTIAQTGEREHLRLLQMGSGFLWTSGAGKQLKPFPYVKLPVVEVTAQDLLLWRQLKMRNVIQGCLWHSTFQHEEAEWHLQFVLPPPCDYSCRSTPSCTWLEIITSQLKTNANVLK